MRRMLSFVLGAVLFGSAAVAGDAVVLSPQTFVRDSGQPRSVKRQFRVRRVSNGHMVRVINRGVTSAVITLNGRVILDADDFSGRGHRDVEILQRRVMLRGDTNQLDVELRSKPG